MRKLHVLMAAMGASILLLLTACGSNGVPDAKNWDLEDFSYIDQDGKPFSKSDLKGKVWVADFIRQFETVCMYKTNSPDFFTIRIFLEFLDDELHDL